MQATGCVIKTQKGFLMLYKSFSSLLLALCLAVLVATPLWAQARTAQVTATANLRSGPGTTFSIVGRATPGQTVTLTGANADGSWQQLDSGVWIASFLVSQVSQPAAGAGQQAAVPPPAPAGEAKVVIQSVAYDGAVYRVESDEYAVIANVGTASINLAGWRLNAGDYGQDFVFPKLELAAGQRVRVYTDEHHPESGGFSFGSGRAIWNNGGDCGYLYNAAGVEVGSYCY
jgi:hypothetical protein